jgi:hypothetical protein
MRNGMMKAMITAAAVSFATTAAPAAAMTELTEKATPEVTRAEQLKVQAEGYFSNPKQWRRAARLLERSAELRSADDADAYSCLVMAGSLRAANGEYAAAQVNYEKAAHHAAARGAVLDAAHAFIDAAHAAAQERSAEAGALAQRARLLASSPLLTADQAQQIIRRIDG